ncbi:hypothetical protein AGLY_001512 [Aphis glycines]|uniref:Uncharacterized protein n=1 Tax=Aphis glycines TaxID=307491 RepID=A0A6G0U5W5_APHGL|nr:hypothetical protein AGLY_001512 [Aphis glycines]
MTQYWANLIQHNKFNTCYAQEKNLITYKSNQSKILNNHSSGYLFSMFSDLGYVYQAKICTKLNVLVIKHSTAGLLMMISVNHHHKNLTFAGIICDSGAASISDCQVLVELGITNPNSKYHSSRQRPYNTQTLNSTFCCNLSFSIGSTEEKFISLDTALHFNIFFGTLASCSLSEHTNLIYIIIDQRYFESLTYTWNPLKISSGFGPIILFTIQVVITILLTVFINNDLIYLSFKSSDKPFRMIKK